MQLYMQLFEGEKLPYNPAKLIVPRQRATNSAEARQGEANNDTIDLEMELLTDELP